MLEIRDARTKKTHLFAELVAFLKRTRPGVFEVGARLGPVGVWHGQGYLRFSIKRPSCCEVGSTNR